MEWLSNKGFITGSSQRPIQNPEKGCDSTGSYDSFKKHWQQAWMIIQRNQQLPSHNDILGVINHLEQMILLLVSDVKNDTRESSNLASSDCLEYLLEENLLDSLYEWSIGMGRYINAVRLVQLKLFEALVSHSRHTLLARDQFLQPLLRLLESCQNDVLPNESQKRLIALLDQLCLLLTQNVDLVDLFVENDPKPRFILFKLLIPFMHREDSIGMQARHALLLCVSMSKKKRNVADFILGQSNMCISLVSRLCGLYSILPHVLMDVTAPDWHRLTPDDVKDIEGLSTFITFLKFSNTIAQVAHSDISWGLEEFMHKRFLMKILRDALLQSNVGEQITAIAYLELILRTVTQPGLLYPLLKFLLQSEHDGERLLTILIERINSEPQLTLVSLALFESLIDVNCEDVMLELIFQYLSPCLHVMLSQRCTRFPLDVRCQNFKQFLNLAPNCCNMLSIVSKIDRQPIHWNHYENGESLYGNYHAYLYDARNKINSCHIACSAWNNGYTECKTKDGSLVSLRKTSSYESLIHTIEKNGEDEVKLPVWQMSSKEINRKQETRKFIDDPNCLTASEAIGPFLTVVLNKLKLLLNNTIYVNIHLTGLISRLAVYPQPLLRAYLLDHTVILHPNIPSLFQIISSLKTVIDNYMSQQTDAPALMEEARSFLIDRERRLVKTRKDTVEQMNSLPTRSTTMNENKQPFQRNNGIRRSFSKSISIISNTFNRRPSEIEPDIPMLAQQDNVENMVYSKFTESQHVAICAILLNEWVKEHTALAQEYAVSQLTSLYK